jgi:iron complex outermembrane recepter protein
MEQSVSLPPVGIWRDMGGRGLSVFAEGSIPMNFKTALLISSTLIALSPIAAMAQTVVPAGATAVPAAEKDDVETIIVSATRRNVAANKVPQNITVIGEQQLREANITDAKALIADNIAINAPQNSARFADSVTVRGLNVSPVSANNLVQFIRTTVSYYIDDTALPNLNYRIKDVNRVETLLGPQGTLYGAGSLGGTIRYITNKPKLGDFDARLSTSIFQAKGGGISSDTDLMLNIPIGEKLAFRLSISHLDEAGTTDRYANPPWRTGALAWSGNPTAAQTVYKDDDWVKTTGGRASLLWQPTERLSFLYAHTQQDQQAHGTTGASLTPLNVANSRTAAELFAAATRDTAPACGTACAFTNEYDTPYAVGKNAILSRYEEYANRELSMDSLEINYDFNFAKLTSATSRYTDSSVGQGDYASQGYVFYYVFGDLGGDLRSNRSAYMTFDNSFEGITSETRLVSNGEGKLNWILGYFYNNQKRAFNFDEVLPGMDAYLGASKAAKSPLPDVGYREILSSDYTENAIFGEVGYQITPKWKAALSARVFNFEDTADVFIVDYAGGFVDNKFKRTGGLDGQSYYRFNTSYDLTPNLLTYFTASQGFRRGGTNPFQNRGSRILSEEGKAYRPDSTNNYELGVKGTVFDNRLYVAAAIFQIDWLDTQTYCSQTIQDFPVNGTCNGPDSQSKGIEFNSRFKINENWSLAYAAGKSQAEWAATKTFAMYTNSASDGRTWTKGGQLGGTPDWKQTFSIRYSDELNDGSKVWATLSGRHLTEIQSDRCDVPGDNNECGILIYPAFTNINYAMGWNTDKFNASFFIENLTSEDVIVSNQAGGILGRRVISLAPQTVGISLTFKR